MLHGVVQLFIGVYADSDSPFTDNEFLQKIFPNIWDFVVQLIAFVILLVIVFFLGYKPIKKLLQKRHDYVEHNLRDAEAAKAIAERNAKTSEASIAEAKTQAAVIVSNAKAESTKAADAIVSKARSDAEEAKKQADQDILAARKKAKEDSRQDIIDVALSATSQVLGREVNEADNARLVSDFVDELDKKKDEGK